MDYFVFARIRGYYLLLDPRYNEFDHELFFAADTLSAILSNETCHAEDLTAVFGDRILFPHPRYRVLVNTDYFLLTPVASRLRRRNLLDILQREAGQRVTEFQLAIRDRLIKALYGENTSLREYVRAWADYFFLDHYSFWVYNKYTKVFSCSASSFELDRGYIFEKENSSLNAVLVDDYQTEFREPIKSFGPDDNAAAFGDMQTINRLKLTLGYDGTIGVLSLYSRHRDYVLTEENCNEMRNSIETKYLQVRHMANQAMDQINLQFIESYQSGQLDQFLFGIVCQVRECFQCEACSIFLANEANKSLDLVASCDNRLHGQPDEPYSYPINSKLPTAEVFCNSRMAFSYDLAADDPDNEGYTESMDHPPVNWIGLPLMSSGRCFGVLRVRNKHVSDENGQTSIINFRAGDYMNLLLLCTNLGNLIRIEWLFKETESKLERTNAAIDEMNDFNKVFLHEIRTPISKFTMAPEIIKRTLKRKNPSPEDIEKVMRQLDDIQVMGDRLEFVAKTFNFNQIVTRRNFEPLSVLRDIVFPVINITRTYLRKQYDIDINLDTTGLQSSRVYGDKTLLNIVFNILIDNAGKYSTGTRKPIMVFGGHHISGDYFDISVSNYGIPIHDSEKDYLFEKGVRGREVIKQGIGGTGIGLHLAKSIMQEGNGFLLLTSMEDPVSFTMRVPVRMEVLEGRT